MKYNSFWYKILAALNPNDKVFDAGFEAMGSCYEGYFDMVSSNIPFGNFRVFDPAFHSSEDEIQKKAAETIHCYFFFKAMDALREGGVMALIVTRALMDTPNNKEEH